MNRYAWWIIAAFVWTPPHMTAQSGSSGIVISQIYGGGGNSGATLRNDYIELFNRSNQAITVTGWSVQYASAAGISWDRTLLTGVIQPGQYYLIQEAEGNGGSISLPTVDLLGGINLSATDGKVVLVNNTTNLTGSAPSGSQIIDFVGYGSANFSEGSPAGTLSNTTAAIRLAGGCADTNNNREDFSVGPPSPRNSHSPVNLCAGAVNTPPSAVGSGNPNPASPGQQVILAGAITAGLNPASQSFTVTCNLGSIGGSSSQILPVNGTAFTYTAAVGTNVLPGVYSLACSVRDDQGRSSNFSISLTIVAVSTAPPGQNNASLQGTYNFRYLGANATSNDVALSFQGTITFDGKADANGNGSFTVSGQGAGATTGPAANNIYGVFSSGILYMNNPFDATGKTFLYGGAGSGTIVASSTDTFFCDLLVAIPVATSASTATLNGNYWLASLDFLSGNFNQTRDTFFSATANGSGSFGNVTVKGTAQNVGPTTPQVQTSAGVTYTVSANGTGTLNFPAPSGVAAANQLLSGNKVLYVSQDGNFFVAGGASGYDMIVGVKAIPGVASNSANGLYFAGYLENFFATDGTFTVYSADGAATEIPSLGVEIGHQRTQPDFANAYDDSYAVNFKPNADGTVIYSGSSYAVGANGNIIIGAGAGRNYQLTLYVKAPSLRGSGVFLNPQGIVNAASNVPFTAGVAPGEFISLAGTGMASQTATASSLPFPATLGGVQVTISWFDSAGRPQSAQAPLYYVSPTLINLVVPYTTPGDGSVMTFKVTSNGTASNVAAVYSGPTSPGIFTVPSGGIGNGAILHADFTLVSPSSPAKVGETVQIFLTGLGAVSPPVAAGTAGPTNPLSTTIVPDVYIDGVVANTVFAGLAPTLGGLYQLNVTIPAGVRAGATVTVEIDTFDSQDDLLAVNAQATIPIAK